jgi:hypothetical protein
MAWWCITGSGSNLGLLVFAIFLRPYTPFPKHIRPKFEYIVDLSCLVIVRHFDALHYEIFSASQNGYYLGMSSELSVVRTVI